MKKPEFIPLKRRPPISENEMITNSNNFYIEMKERRTIRDFSDKPVPKEVIKNCIKTAGTAPSGANMQPWHFVVVSDPQIKKEIRIAAEKEEYDFYHNRAPEEWLNALAPFGTDEHKPFLETAPYLIVIFEQKYGVTENGQKVKHYFTAESVGIATGMLITALHRVGLATLTHTPSPMRFLNEILKRPENEKPFLLLVVGFPADKAQVPKIKRKTLNEITTSK
jgi:nitroreductase